MRLSASHSSTLLQLLRDFILRDSIRDQYGVKAYARFKDDLFLLVKMDGGNLSRLKRDWLTSMNIRSCPFKFEKWEASMEGVEYLDLYVYRTEGSTKLSWRPHIKVTSLGVFVISGICAQQKDIC